MSNKLHGALDTPTASGSVQEITYQVAQEGRKQKVSRVFLLHRNAQRFISRSDSPLYSEAFFVKLLLLPVPLPPNWHADHFFLAR